MSKERARRRAERLAAAQAVRERRERASRRRAGLRSMVRAVTPRLPDRRTGQLFARRSRAQRAGITVVTGGALALIWLLGDSFATKLAISVVVLVAAPALIVLTLDRRT